MVISDVKAVYDVGAGSVKLVTESRDAYLRRDVEQHALPGKTKVQRRRINERRDQVIRHGLAQDDEHLLSGGNSAVPLLDKMDEKAERLPKKNPFSRVLNKWFPNRTQYQLQATQEATDADCSEITEFNATHEALQKRSAYTPAAFPFSRHDKYVEIPGSIQEVRDALEGATGKCVIIHGEAGIGKSTLAISIGRYYERQRKQPQQMDSPPVETPRFPDGIHYLGCGKGVQKEERQLKLLEIMGFPSASVAAGVQDGPSRRSAETNKRNLRTKLARKKVLTILDDLWDPEVLEGVFVDGDGAEGVKYLVSSQKRNIWDDAKRIKQKLPGMTEARQILANYIQDRPQDSRFPDEVQPIVDEIIQILEYHPLSLADVGMSILPEKANDVDYWRSTRLELRDNLSVGHKPRGHDKKPYSLTVRASMMLAVERLVEDKRPIFPLLDLMALLSPVPESVLKWFYDRIQPTRSSSFHTELKALVDGSMIEMWKDGNDDCILTMHGLRIHFIQEERRSEVFAVAVKLLSSRNLIDILESFGDAFDLSKIKPFNELVKNPFDHLSPLEIRHLYVLKTAFYLIDNWSSLFTSSVVTTCYYLLVLYLASIVYIMIELSVGYVVKTGLESACTCPTLPMRNLFCQFPLLITLSPILVIGSIYSLIKVPDAISATLELYDYFGGSGSVSRVRWSYGKQSNPHPELLALQRSHMIAAMLRRVRKFRNQQLLVALVLVFLALYCFRQWWWVWVWISLSESLIFSWICRFENIYYQELHLESCCKHPAALPLFAPAQDASQDEIGLV